MNCNYKWMEWTWPMANGHFCPWQMHCTACGATMISVITGEKNPFSFSRVERHMLGTHTHTQSWSRTSFIFGHRIHFLRSLRSSLCVQRTKSIEWLTHKWLMCEMSCRQKRNETTKDVYSSFPVAHGSPRIFKCLLDANTMNGRLQRSNRISNWITTKRKTRNRNELIYFRQ